MNKTKQLVHQSFDDNFMQVEQILETCNRVFVCDMNVQLGIDILREQATQELAKLLKGRSCNGTVLGLIQIYNMVFKGLD